MKSTKLTLDFLPSFPLILANFRVFPNPANNSATIEGDVVDASFPLLLMVFDGSGKTVQIREVSEVSDKVSIQISLVGFAAGGYNFQVVDAEKNLLDSGMLWKQ